MLLGAAGLEDARSRDEHSDRRGGMPEPGDFDDDGIDWAAALTAAEDAEAGYLQSRKNVERAGRQQRIDSFFKATTSVDHRNEEIPESAAVEGVQVPIDPIAATTWVYPDNVPRREYQFSIAKTALFTNTLVSLPTGLGKTLIAAVVIYNFYRWFPEGKVVFTAPSKPLVLQQIEACHNVVGIPQDLTIDMTGQINPSQRAAFWKSKRVFFVTPQVLEKDIKSGTCPLRQLVCLVVDEAHRALGNYSYCVVVREIISAKVVVRILALTATPGSKHTTIQSVVDNLHISCMEYRNEDDPDVSQYTHDRKLEVVSVPLSAEAKKLRDMLTDVLLPVVSKLCNYGVFYNRDISRLTPYEFLTAREKFRQAPPASLAQGQTGELEGCFGIAITLCHILKLLSSHGIKPASEMLQQKMHQGFLAKVMGRNEKMLQIKQLMHQTVNHGAPSPKLDKMKEIVTAHFGVGDPAKTRAIIFTNFRESVKDIMDCLSKLNGAVKAMEFIGQSSGKTSKGQSQKIQQQVLQKFRSGGYNTIVATCIGEEGLDIMEVDLVICFDANISPLRMIQRMGRTGRNRDGRVVVLASEGTELQGYLNKQAKGKAIGKHMVDGGVRSFTFHASSRMVPHVFKPELQIKKLTIEQFVPRGRKARQAATCDPTAELTSDENTLLCKYFQSSEQEIWKPSLIAFPSNQLTPTAIHSVKHSTRTTSMLIGVLQELRELPPSNANDNVVSILEPSNAKEKITCEMRPSHACDPEELISMAENDKNSVCKPVREPSSRSPEEPCAGDSTYEPTDWQEEAVHPVPYELLLSPTSENAPPESSPVPAEISSPPTHSFYFTEGVVSLTNEGCVMIASPPIFDNQPADAPISSPTPENEAQKDVECVPETPDIDQQEIIYETPAPMIFEVPSGSVMQKGGGSSSNEDWRCRTSELPSSVQKPPLKRLKRGGGELFPSLVTPEYKNRATNAEKAQIRQAVRRFIDEEAEVSSDAEVSADTVFTSDAPSSEGFINDNLQSRSGGSVDMMAVYRRSLLTQSPGEALVPRAFISSETPGSSSAVKSSGRTSCQDSLAASYSGRKSVSFNLPPSRGSTVTQREQEEFERSTREMRKRKLSFHAPKETSSGIDVDCSPGFDNGRSSRIHTEHRQEVESVKTDIAASNGATSWVHIGNRQGTATPKADVAGPSHDIITDDLFDGVDLDALEAEAAKQCRLRSSQTPTTTDAAGADEQMDEDFDCLPSFDLGF